MYEYIFKGFTCISTGQYSYQVIEKEEGVSIFTNDYSPESYLYKIKKTGDFEYDIEGTSYLESMLSSGNSRSQYFTHLVNAKLN
jgi:hypothetical protein